MLAVYFVHSKLHKIVAKGALTDCWFGYEQDENNEPTRYLDFLYSTECRVETLELHGPLIKFSDVEEMTSKVLTTLFGVNRWLELKEEFEKLNEAMDELYFEI